MDFVIGLILVVGIGELPIEMMHDSLAVCIGFKRKGFIAVAVTLHLVGVKLLCALYQRIQFCVYIGLCSAIPWQKIDEVHLIFYLWNGVSAIIGGFDFIPRCRRIALGIYWGCDTPMLG